MYLHIMKCAYMYMCIHMNMIEGTYVLEPRSHLISFCG